MNSVALAGINGVSTSLVRGKGQFELVSNGISTLHYEDWVNSCHSHIHLTVKGDVWACMCSWSCISAEPSPVKFCESLWQWASWLGFQYPAFPVCSVFSVLPKEPQSLDSSSYAELLSMSVPGNGAAISRLPIPGDHKDTPAFLLTVPRRVSQGLKHRAGQAGVLGTLSVFVLLSPRIFSAGCGGCMGHCAWIALAGCRWELKQDLSEAVGKLADR